MDEIKKAFDDIYSLAYKVAEHHDKESEPYKQLRNIMKISVENFHQALNIEKQLPKENEVIVPIIPTDEMIQKGWNDFNGESMIPVYSAMIRERPYRK